MFGSLFSNKVAPVGTTAPALPQSGSGLSGMSQSEMQSICLGVQQRMQAIQSMHAGSFLTFSYVLADSPAQIQQVYNSAFQTGVHHDSGKWHEAKVRNPDSQLAYPLPINGMSALCERSKQQAVHLTNLVAATDTAKVQISNLKAHTDRLILTELSNCEKKNDALSIQLSKLCLGIELFGLQNCKASVDFAKHRELMGKLERVQQNLSLAQKKLRLAKTAQKQLPQQHGLKKEESTDKFISLKTAVDARVSAAYSSVLDRCRSIASQRAQERLKLRASDALAELKRQYVSTPSFPFRTMTSDEINMAKRFAMDPAGALSAVPLPPVFSDLFAFILASKTPVTFLEDKFGAELTRAVGGQNDKRSVLHAYSRQRSSDPWFPLYAAFRAGWSGVLLELANTNVSPECAFVATVLAKRVDNEPVQVDLSRFSQQKYSPYRDILVAACTGELGSIVIQQVLPECTAFDWAWWGLRGGEPIETLREKMAKLPRNYFEESTTKLPKYPSLTNLHHGEDINEKPSAVSSLVEQCLLNWLVGRFEPGIEILKPKTESFNIGNALHRAALWSTIALDKLGAQVNSEFAAALVAEAALPVNVLTERNMYLTSVSAETGSKVETLLRNLDTRRVKA